MFKWKISQLIHRRYDTQKLGLVKRRIEALRAQKIVTIIACNHKYPHRILHGYFAELLGQLVGYREILEFECTGLSHHCNVDMVKVETFPQGGVSIGVT